MTESNYSVMIVGVIGSLFLAFMGLLIGAWVAQFLTLIFPAVFVVPLALNITIGCLLVRVKRRQTGEVILFGGTIASVALPFILL